MRLDFSRIAWLEVEAAVARGSLAVLATGAWLGSSPQAASMLVAVNIDSRRTFRERLPCRVATLTMNHPQLFSSQIVLSTVRYYQVTLPRSSCNKGMQRD